VIFINESFNKNKSKKNLVENSRIGFEILDSEINFRISNYSTLGIPRHYVIISHGV